LVKRLMELSSEDLTMTDIRRRLCTKGKALTTRSSSPSDLPAALLADEDEDDDDDDEGDEKTVPSLPSRMRHWLALNISTSSGWPINPSPDIYGGQSG
jgi:hypothetical protein